MTATIHPDNYDYLTFCIYAKTPLHAYKVNPQNRSTSSLSNCISLRNPGTMSSEMWRLEQTRVSEQKKTNITTSGNKRDFSQISTQALWYLVTKHDSTCVKHSVSGSLPHPKTWIVSSDKNKICTECPYISSWIYNKFIEKKDTTSSHGGS